jgi:mRNA interferase RelE/StbE
VTYRIEILPSAVKDMASLAPTIRRRVDRAIRSLADEPTPAPPKGKSLAGGLKGLFRLRVGDYRVVYRVVRERIVVTIIAVAHRGEIYRRLKGLR